MEMKCLNCERVMELSSGIVPSEIACPECGQSDWVVNPSEDDENVVRKGFWAKIRKVAGRVPFVLDAVAMYYCAVDRNTPVWVKGTAFAALAYFISPIDLIPDAIPVLGFTDDAAVIATTVVALGSHITAEHRDSADEWANGPKE